MKPYQRNEQFTRLDNWFWDVAMPKMKPSAWTVFCFIYRETQGWQTDRKELSYKRIIAGTGINSVNTVKKALKYLRNEGLITVLRYNGRPDTYCLNLDLEVPDPHQKMTPPLKNLEGPPPKNGEGPPPKNDTQSKKGNKGKKTDPAGAAADSKLDEILTSLDIVSRQMKNPLAAPEKIAETLLKRGETKSSVLNAWEVCKLNATRSVGGSFINWINSNWLPTTNTNDLTFKTNDHKHPPPPSSAAPPAPRSVGGNATEYEWAARQPRTTGDEVVSRSRKF